MDLDSRTLAALLTDSTALNKYGFADWTPCPGVLDMNAAAPVGVIGSTVELREEFAHARHRAEHSLFALEITGGTFELVSTPTAHANFSSASGGEWFAGFECVMAPLRAKLLRSTAQDGLVTDAAAVVDRVAPSSNEVTLMAAIRCVTPRIINDKWSFTRLTYTLTTMFTKTLFRVLWLKLGRARHALLRPKHTSIIARLFEISPEYVKIAEDRLARIDAQPSLFQPKPEQLTLGGGE